MKTNWTLTSQKVETNRMVQQNKKTQPIVKLPIVTARRLDAKISLATTIMVEEAQALGNYLWTHAHWLVTEVICGENVISLKITPRYCHLVEVQQVVAAEAE